MNWIYLVHDKDQLRRVVNTVTKRRVTYDAGNLSPRIAAIINSQGLTC
jgi:hypothetical protein